MIVYEVSTVFDWLYLLSLVVFAFEIGNIVFRKMKRKPIKWHLWILLVAFLIIVFWYWIGSSPFHGDPIL